MYEINCNEQNESSCLFVCSRRVHVLRLKQATYSRKYVTLAVIC